VFFNVSGAQVFESFCNFFGGDVVLTLFFTQITPEPGSVFERRLSVRIAGATFAFLFPVKEIGDATLAYSQIPLDILVGKEIDFLRAPVPVSAHAVVPVDFKYPVEKFAVRVETQERPPDRGFEESVVICRAGLYDFADFLIRVFGQERVEGDFEVDMPFTFFMILLNEFSRYIIVVGNGVCGEVRQIPVCAGPVGVRFGVVEEPETDPPVMREFGEKEELFAEVHIREYGAVEKIEGVRGQKRPYRRTVRRDRVEHMSSDQEVRGRPPCRRHVGDHNRCHENNRDYYKQHCINKSLDGLIFRIITK